MKGYRRFYGPDSDVFYDTICKIFSEALTVVAIETVGRGRRWQGGGAASTKLLIDLKTETCLVPIRLCRAL